jgi:hypothetical protein
MEIAVERIVGPIPQVQDRLGRGNGSTSLTVPERSRGDAERSRSVSKVEGSPGPTSAIFMQSGERKDHEVSALSRIVPSPPFPRSLSSAEAGERESSFFRTDVDPRPSASSGQALRGGDNNGDFHLVGWAGGPWALGMTLGRSGSSSHTTECTWACGSPKGMKLTTAVVPAQAGTHGRWIPAFAGMT